MILFIIIWSAWFLSEILLNLMLRSGESDKRNEDKGTLSVIWILIGTANCVGIMVTVNYYLPIVASPLIQYFGLFLIVAGMVIRFIAVWSLGKLFTVDVTIREGHKIKQDGLYHLMRHPSYSGSLLSFIGFGFSLNNWLSLIIISVLITIAFLYRIRIEEKLLKTQFGEDYSEYMKKTYRLIPWIY